MPTVLKFAPDLLKGYAQNPPAKPKELRYFEEFGHMRGEPRPMLHVSYSGKLTWHVLFYDNGKPRTQKIEGGVYPAMSIEAARKRTKEFKSELASAAAQGGTFQNVAEEWIRRYVDKKGLRSKPEIERHLKSYVYEEWKSARIFDIKREHVTKLLDTIEDEHGASQADAVLATIRSIMSWYAARNGDYNSPIVPKMKRAAPKARDRILSDDEIRCLWTVCDDNDLGNFGPLVKIMLLTAQRREKVGLMKHTDLADDIWTVRNDHEREKGHAGKVRLPRCAVDIIDGLDRRPGNPYIFFGSERGRGRHARSRLSSGNNVKPTPPAFNSWAQRKREIDSKLEALIPDMEPWVLHDLRRTARSLMARAGVADHIAERTIGHALQGVMKIYNRYDYFEEKSDALQRLADQIDLIVNPPRKTNVVPLRS